MNKTLRNKLISYVNLPIEQKEIILTQAYTEQKMSYAAIAQIAGTYPVRIRRDAQKFNIPPRPKSEAQQEALKSKRHKHPTEGKKRSLSVREQISDSMAESWEKMDDNEKQRRIDIGKKTWNDRTYVSRKETQKAAIKGILLSSKIGSKLERFLHKELINVGYTVEMHKDHLLANEQLHLDLLLPTLGVAIEVDGISHDKPIWGNKALSRTKKSDQQKDGLILQNGMIIIRIKYSKTLSGYRQRQIFKKLLNHIENIEQKFPPVGERYIVIEEN